MMDRRAFILLGGAAIATSATRSFPSNVWADQPPQLGLLDPRAAKLIEAAKRQIGVTVIYDPAYVGLTYPNGDVLRDRGGCSDVIIRAYRDAFDFDLQQAVHLDMKAHFSAYPTRWGLKRPDRNIDHRRVLNLARYFERQGADLPVTDQPETYLPGDVVEQVLPGNLPHMSIVSDEVSRSGNPMVVHNIGGGTRLEDRLFAFKVVGHFRFFPKQTPRS